jgi:hypothetical protein
MQLLFYIFLFLFSKKRKRKKKYIKQKLHCGSKSKS